MTLETPSPADSAPVPPVLRPQAFDYLDYRRYLADWLSWKKQAQRRYSSAVFAKMAGLKSHNLLGLVTRGERNLGESARPGFIQALGIAGKEARYFERLVEYNQAEGAQRREDALAQLLAATPQGRGKEILRRIHDHVSFLKRWYIVAIRELVAFDDFKNDSTWIAKKLKDKVTVQQVESAIEILKRLGLVRQENGTLARVHAAIDIASEPHRIDYAIQNFHRDFLKRADDAIQTEPRDERDMSSFTVAVSREDFEAIQKEVSDFRIGLNERFPSKEGKRDHLVTVNMQVLLLSKKERVEK